jgi:hypothetical protein
MAKEILDAEGRFRFGKYGPNEKRSVGLSTFEVKSINPGYLSWVLENIDLIDEDEKIISSVLKWGQR